MYGSVLPDTCNMALSCTQAADRQFLNVSYDATREFYDEFNKSFGAILEKRTGKS